jgi:putative transcriptional regulator
MRRGEVHPSDGDDPEARQLRIRFGQDLKAARTRAGLSQAQVAERIGLSQQYVSSVERGLFHVTITTMAALARALGYDLVISFRPTHDGQPSSLINETT